MSALKKIRRKRGLTIEDVASRAGISYDYVRRLEGKQHVPTLGIARRLAAALGATVDELFPETRTGAA